MLNPRRPKSFFQFQYINIKNWQSSPLVFIIPLFITFILFEGILRCYHRFLKNKLEYFFSPDSFIHIYIICFFIQFYYFIRIILCMPPEIVDPFMSLIIHLIQGLSFLDEIPEMYEEACIIQEFELELYNTWSVNNINNEAPNHSIFCNHYSKLDLLMTNFGIYQEMLMTNKVFTCRLCNGEYPSNYIPLDSDIIRLGTINMLIKDCQINSDNLMNAINLNIELRIDQIIIELLEGISEDSNVAYTISNRYLKQTGNYISVKDLPALIFRLIEDSISEVPKTFSCYLPKPSSYYVLFGQEYLSNITPILNNDFSYDTLCIKDLYTYMIEIKDNIVVSQRNMQMSPQMLNNFFNDKIPNNIEESFERLNSIYENQERRRLKFYSVAIITLGITIGLLANEINKK